MESSAANLPERLIARIAAATTFLGWGLIALAEAGALNRATSLAMLATALLGQRALLRFEGLDQAPVGRRTTAALFAIAALAAAASMPPNDSRLWGGDATVALASARQIALHGGLEFHDPLPGTLAAEERELLFRNRTPADTTGPYVRFPGGFAMGSPQDDRVSAGFSPLYPVLGAAVIQWLGVKAMPWIAPGFAVLAGLALALLGGRLIGRTPGLVAAAALVVSLPQAWLARAGTPAPLATFLLVCGLLVLMLSRGLPQPRGRFVAGAILGVGMFAAADLLVTLTWGLLAAAWLAAARDRQLSGLRPLLAAYAMLLLHNVVHYALWPSHYRTWFLQLARRELPAGALRGAPEVPAVALVAVAGAVAVVGLLLFRGRRARWLLPAVLGLATVIAAMLYARVSTPNPVAVLHWLAWSLSWPAIALVLLAIVIPASGLVRRRPGWRRVEGGDASSRTALAILAATCIPYLFDPQANSDALLAMRRFMPVVVPAALLAAAWAANRIARAAAGQVGDIALSRALPAAAAAVLVIAAGHRTLPLVGERWGMTGGASNDASLAATLPEDALVLVSSDLSGLHLATHLAYLQDRHAVQLQTRYPESGVLVALLERRLQAGQPTHLLVGSEGLNLSAPILALEPELQLAFEARHLSSPDRSDSLLLSERVEASLLRVAAAREFLTSVDVGDPASDSFVEMRGFHGAESDPTPAADPTFRWTGEVATALIDGTRNVEIMLDGGRPVGAPGARIAVWIDDRLVIPERELGNGMQALYAISAEPSANPRRLTLRVSTFNPQALGIGEDTRDLGVRVFALRYY